MLVLAALWLIPRLVQQLGDLVAALPGWLAQGETLLQQLQSWATERGLPTDFGDLSSELITRTSQLASQLSQQLLSLLGATLGLTVNTLIVIVLTVFLLLGGERISQGLALWLPPTVRPLVVTTLSRTFRGYFAGQVVLALILSGAQMVVFTLLGIPYGVLFAVAIGFTTLVPYASALTIVIVSRVAGPGGPQAGGGGPAERHHGGAGGGSGDPAPPDGQHRGAATGLAADQPADRGPAREPPRPRRAAGAAAGRPHGQLHQDLLRCLGRSAQASAGAGMMPFSSR